MPADTCKVSVVVAAYNATNHLPACFDSMLVQTLTDWEIIVVDDHSTDTTAAMVQSYIARDDRIRLLRTPSNGGPSVARNLGFAAARGTWIAILDSDDRFRPERLQRMVEYGETAGSDIVSDNPVIVTPEDPAGSNMFTAPSMATAHRVGLEEFILGNISKRDEPRVAFGFMKPILKAAFIRDNGIRYDELMRFSEDFVLYITCLQHGARWDFVPEGMYLYTIRGDSLSDSSVRHSRELVRLFEFSRALAQSKAVQADPAAQRAATLYFEKVRRWYSYRALMDALKTRQFGAAASLLYRSPDAIGGVVAEAMVQAPALARKAARKIPGLGARLG